MPKYFVTVPTTATAYRTIEADSPEEAIEQFETPSICAQCSGWGQDYDLDLGEDWDWDNAKAEPADD